MEDWLSDLNPHSKEVIPEAYAVPSLANAVLGDRFQFERLGNLFFLLLCANVYFLHHSLASAYCLSFSFLKTGVLKSSINSTGKKSVMSSYFYYYKIMSLRT